MHKAHLRQHSNSCLLDAEAAECSQLLEISMPKPATNDGHSTNSPIITNRFHWKVTLIMPMTDAQETGTRKTGNGFWYVWHTILHWFFLYQILVLGYWIKHVLFGARNWYQFLVPVSGTGFIYKIERLSLIKIERLSLALDIYPDGRWIGGECPCGKLSTPGFSKARCRAVPVHTVCRW